MRRPFWLKRPWTIKAHHAKALKKRYTTALLTQDGFVKTQDMNSTNDKDLYHHEVIDAHAHLDEVPQVQEALETARKKGVKAVVGVGMDTPSNKTILALASRFSGFVFPAIGIHPWNLNAGTLEHDLAFIDEHLPDCIALGEVGLDYKAKVKKPLQKKVFQELLFFAREYGKPVITHSRFSHQTTLRMVLETGIQKAVFHWYSGPLELLEVIAEHGHMISATPALEYSKPHQDAVRKIPLENLLLETDCPVKYGNLESRPEHVLITLSHVSRLKQMDPETVARVTTSNAQRLFGFDIRKA